MPMLDICENEVIFRGPPDELNLFPLDGFMAVVSRGFRPGRFLFLDESESPCGFTVAGARVVLESDSGRLKPVNDLDPRSNFRVGENADSGRVILP